MNVVGPVHHRHYLLFCLPIIFAFVHREQLHIEQPCHTIRVGQAVEVIREETACHACTMVATPTKHAKPLQRLATVIPSIQHSLFAESHTLREPIGSDDRTLRDTIRAILMVS